MKKEGNRLRSEAVDISNNIIDSLIESNDNFTDKTIQIVREKMKSVLLFNTNPNIPQVINSDINIFNLILRVFKKSVKSDVYSILTYN
jgi:predicted KAP-like P-loop ATPase